MSRSGTEEDSFLQVKKFIIMILYGSNMTMYSYPGGWGRFVISQSLRDGTFSGSDRAICHNGAVVAQRVKNLSGK
ncbi:hypothetical protein DdX_17388 [Ditylenchus destructor]|uniref:Uncharacterized protein n=1 Tax=Ditylenchus destructor TaxID=166010 RepID=A0AAD4QVU6_9BILA|nr:hypothetical protein DdX_17388 [Ditylenchus destructor]